MCTKDIEKYHEIDIRKILEEEGLECIRMVVDVEESKSLIIDDEQNIPVEEQDKVLEELGKEEEAIQEEEASEEAVPYLFPTPSLRRVLPDRVREIEQFNRIHVLPEKFNYRIDPSAIPRIGSTNKQRYIDTLAELVGCTEYKTSLAEYWFLDTLANLLRRAQEEYMDRSSQAILIAWFCEWMKEIQYFDAADRRRMLERFKENMLAAAKFVETKERLPMPHEIGVSHKPPEETPEQLTASATPSKLLISFQDQSYECTLRDLTDIIHYIYDLFSTDYQFELVQSVFTFSPDYTLVDAPYHMNQPKKMYEPPKVNGKKEGKNGNGKKNGNAKKNGRTNGKKEGSFNKLVPAAGDAAEYIRELQMREQMELDAIEEREREVWLQKSSILPLSMAVDDEFFQKYFPS